MAFIYRYITVFSTLCQIEIITLDLWWETSLLKRKNTVEFITISHPLKHSCLHYINVWYMYFVDTIVVLLFDCNILYWCSWYHLIELGEQKTSGSITRVTLLYILIEMIESWSSLFEWWIKMTFSIWMIRKNIFFTSLISVLGGKILFEWYKNKWKFNTG